MSASEVKPCPFCGGGTVDIEGKGQVWRGVKGYSDPQYFELTHFGRLSEEDDFPRCTIKFRCRTEADAINFWNARARELALVRDALDAAAKVANHYEGSHKIRALDPEVIIRRHDDAQ